MPNPSSASLERLFRVFNVLGIEIMLSSEFDRAGPRVEKITADYLSSPARKEKW